MSRSTPAAPHPSPWPHRLALALACATFPLIWVGGLVTSTDAGMAVPDWPTTYGYNLFLYPWTTWIFGPWDLLVEHGHRLLGALVGILAIGLWYAVWRFDPRRSMRFTAVVAVVLVVAQGVLGGLRVVFDERLLAMLHGCVGPLFFSLCVAMVASTSPRAWQHGRPRPTDKEGDRDWEGKGPASFSGGGRPASLANRTDRSRQLRVAVVTTALVYGQLVLGALVRHMPVWASPYTYRVVLFFHLLVAAVLVGHVVALATGILRSHRDVPALARASGLLLALVVLQLGLGAATWVVKFGWPSWFDGMARVAGYTVRDGSLLQTHIVTAHVAVGSLILATSGLVTFLLTRCVPVDSLERPTPTVGVSAGGWS